MQQGPTPVGRKLSAPHSSAGCCQCAVRRARDLRSCSSRGGAARGARGKGRAGARAPARRVDDSRARARESRPFPGHIVLSRGRLSMLAALGLHGIAGAGTYTKRAQRGWPWRGARVVCVWGLGAWRQTTTLARSSSPMHPSFAPRAGAGPRPD